MTRRQREVCQITTKKNGWLRYGPGIPANVPFGHQLKERIPDAAFVQLDHSTLALRAYKGHIPGLSN